MSRNYDRRTVEALLSVLWDPDVVWGLKQDEVPDPQMPKAKANPAHGNTLGAMMADIQRAWKLADVPTTERRVLVLRHALDWTYQEIGDNQGVTHKAALYRDERGVGRLTAFLNGDKYHDNYESTPSDDGVHV